MRLAVFGSGGVGGYFGGRLAEAGEEVAFVARGAHLEAIRRDGLAVESPAGDLVVRPAAAAADPGEIGPVDAVLVAVKAWQVPAAAAAIPPLLGPEAFAVPLENGVEAADQLASALGEERVVPGLCKIVSMIAGPGRIRHLGVSPWIAFAERDGGKSERVERLRRALAACRGVTVEIPEDIEAAIWEKFLFIAPVSAVGAVTRMPVGVVRQVPETRRLLERAMEEIAALAVARRVRLPGDAVERALAYVDGMPAESTASMQRDLVAGRPSELESQSGAVVRLAREAGVPVPAHRFLYSALLPAELRARGVERASTGAAGAANSAHG